jgi:hypothetical protein
MTALERFLTVRGPSLDGWSSRFILQFVDLPLDGGAGAAGSRRASDLVFIEVVDVVESKSWHWVLLYPQSRRMTRVMASVPAQATTDLVRAAGSNLP